MKVDSFRDFRQAIELLKNPENKKLFTDCQLEEITEIQTAIRSLNTALTNQFLEITERLNKAFASYQENIQRFQNSILDIKYFVSKDWYVSLSFFEHCSPQDLYHLTRKENLNKLEQFVLSNFKKQQKNIYQRLNKNYPNRAHIFRELQDLYKRKHYHSLIVLAYSQIDGISNEKFQLGFFDTNKKIPTKPLKVASSIRANECIGLGSFLTEQLQIRNEMCKSSDSIKDKTSSFNRHVVLHGHSYLYGTELNSVRVLLLLDFVNDLSELIN